MFACWMHHTLVDLLALLINTHSIVSPQSTLMTQLACTKLQLWWCWAKVHVVTSRVYFWSVFILVAAYALSRTWTKPDTMHANSPSKLYTVLNRPACSSVQSAVQTVVASSIVSDASWTRWLAPIWCNLASLTSVDANLFIIRWWQPGFPLLDSLSSLPVTCSSSLHSALSPQSSV